jgi:hypothetical protein
VILAQQYYVFSITGHLEAKIFSYSSIRAICAEGELNVLSVKNYNIKHKYAISYDAKYLISN